MPAECAHPACREDILRTINDKIKEGIKEHSILWWDIWDLINEMVEKTHNRSWN